MSSIASQQPGAAPPGTARALRWWLGEIRSLFADAALFVREHTGNRLTIVTGERQWMVRSKGQVLGLIDWEPDAEARRRMLRAVVARAGRRARIIIEIPPDRVLSKSISLPAAAEGEIERILRFEFPRHFPFPPERVVYRHRVIANPGNADRLLATVAAVPRDVVTSITEEIAAAGLRASGIAIQPGHDEKPFFLLDAPDGSKTGGRTRFVPIVTALAAILAATSWPAAQRQELAQIQREIAAVKPKGEAVLNQREQDRRRTEQSAAVVRLRTERPPLVGLLDELSRAIPDDSWLTSLSITGRDVLLQGLSPSASKLALVLANNPLFATAVFREPISRDPASGLERFQLAITVGEPRQ